MHKKDLRKIYREKRASLTPEEADRMSKSIIDILLHHIDFNLYTNVHTYLPIRQRNEINTFYFIERIRKEFPHIRLLSPVTNLTTHHMQTVLLKPDTLILANDWGIPEPVHGEAFPDSEIDLVLIPLLCLDILGNRVGYGKGHYDRFLANCRAEVPKVGLSYFAPVPVIDGLENTDIPLDFAVAQGQFLIF